ncbi:MAG: glutamine-hydrolyzing carbamoyl-phosphate synthase small subunit [Bacteroidetes bacterium]|nr:glutamine-hydrolyzing carbamoyl-phosphate synthase small subunit [Bacteroidota bacterium]
MSNSSKPTTARLVLEDGTEYAGFSFGARLPAAGELVFTTAMTGYPESLTDPSYAGQIIVLTYPSVGNYGVPAGHLTEGLHTYFESDRIHAAGLIIADYSERYNHWNAARSLSDWLEEQGVPGIYGLDTRMLTKKIRAEGSMLARIEFDSEIPFFDPSRTNLVAQVSCKAPVIYGNGQHRILLIDCGVKTNIIRYLLRYDTTVVRVPWDFDPQQVQYDGLFISNGPGDPVQCEKTIAHLRKSLDDERPIFGICLGHQLLSLASGATTQKLRFGHRGHNQPVLETGTQRAWLTSQNHGYAVVPDSIPEGWLPGFINLNDHSNEGIRHLKKPFFSTQFHPEAAGGPTDTSFMFNRFIENIKAWKQKH